MSFSLLRLYTFSQLTLAIGIAWWLGFDTSWIGTTLHRRFSTVFICTTIHFHRTWIIVINLHTVRIVLVLVMVIVIEIEIMAVIVGNVHFGTGIQRRGGSGSKHFGNLHRVPVRVEDGRLENRCRRDRGRVGRCRGRMVNVTADELVSPRLRMGQVGELTMGRSIGVILAMAMTVGMSMRVVHHVLLVFVSIQVFDELSKDQLRTNL